MYFREHSPAHFHAEYGEYEAPVEIETLAILRKELPRRALALVLALAGSHLFVWETPIPRQFGPATC